MTLPFQRNPARRGRALLTLVPAPPSVGGHLTSDQMGDLLASTSSSRSKSQPFDDPDDPDAIAAPAAAAQAHLRACPACAAEFASLREALALFHEASVALADREFNRIERLSQPIYPVLPVHRAYTQTLLWVAASAILVAGILPLELRWQRSAPAPAVATSDSSAVAFAKAPESDEALLADIDRELSASVPTSMQALADPTGYQATPSSDATVSQPATQPSTQRKD